MPVLFKLATVLDRLKLFPATCRDSNSHKCGELCVITKKFAVYADSLKVDDWPCVKCQAFLGLYSLPQSRLRREAGYTDNSVSSRPNKTLAAAPN